MADLILVVAELSDGQPKKITYELLSAAQTVAGALDYEIGVAVLGDDFDSESLAADFGAHGAGVLFAVQDKGLAEYNVEPYAVALQQLIEQEEAELVLMGMTTIGRELAPRLAGKLQAGLASDVTALTVEDGEVLITRPMYSGQVMATVKVKGSPVLVTLRPNSWPISGPGNFEAAQIEEVTPDDLPESRVAVLSVEAKGGDRPALGDAPTIVSGGRGLQNAANFSLIEELADQLGGAVGATRAVVDAGWRPYEEQVGQTGKTVAPQLYIAAGISGALQHLSGMRTSKTIVAINKDKDAPIFKLADYGIVGDLHQVLPELQKALKEIK